MVPVANDGLNGCSSIFLTVAICVTADLACINSLLGLVTMVKTVVCEKHSDVRHHYKDSSGRCK